MRTHLTIHVPTYIHTYIHAYIHTYIHVYIHIHTYLHAYIYAEDTYNMHPSTHHPSIHTCTIIHPSITYIPTSFSSAGMAFLVIVKFY